MSKIVDIPTAMLRHTTARQMCGSLAVVEALSVLVSPEAPDMLNAAEKRLVKRTQNCDDGVKFCYYGNRERMQLALDTLDLFSV